MEEKTYCSFCLNSNQEVETLVAGPGVHICESCIQIANEILEGAKKEFVAKKFEPIALADEEIKEFEEIFVLRKNAVQLLDDAYHSASVFWDKLRKKYNIPKYAVYHSETRTISKSHSPAFSLINELELFLKMEREENGI